MSQFLFEIVFDVSCLIVETIIKFELTAVGLVLLTCGTAGPSPELIDSADYPSIGITVVPVVLTLSGAIRDIKTATVPRWPREEKQFDCKIIFTYEWNPHCSMWF